MVSRGELLLVELNNYSGTWRAGLGDVTQRVHKFVMCLLLLVSLVRIYIRAEQSSAELLLSGFITSTHACQLYVCDAACVKVYECVY
eukprot:18206-Heterococcus_DN1.PRE.2